jgi:hypothetical protein
MCSDGHDPRTCFQRRMCNQVCASPQQQGCGRKRGTEHQRRRRLRTSSTTGESTGNMRAVFPTTTTTPRKYSTSCESLTLKAILESRGTPEAKTARRFYDALKHRAHKHADTYVPAKQNTQPGEDTSAQITARGTSNAPLLDGDEDLLPLVERLLPVPLVEGITPCSVCLRLQLEHHLLGRPPENANEVSACLYSCSCCLELGQFRLPVAVHSLPCLLPRHPQLGFRELHAGVEQRLDRHFHNRVRGLHGILLDRLSDHLRNQWNGRRGPDNSLRLSTHGQQLTCAPAKQTSMPHALTACTHASPTCKGMVCTIALTLASICGL